MDYYGNNDYRDYLALRHHGILGMKWGKRNGPPYPLGSGDHSASEKKAGWRKSLGGGSSGNIISRARAKNALRKTERASDEAAKAYNKAESTRRIQSIKNPATGKESRFLISNREYENDAKEKVKKYFESYADMQVKAKKAGYEVVVDKNSGKLTLTRNGISSDKQKIISKAEKDYKNYNKDYNLNRRAKYNIYDEDLGRDIARFQSNHISNKDGTYTKYIIDAKYKVPVGDVKTFKNTRSLYSEGELLKTSKPSSYDYARIEKMLEERSELNNRVKKIIEKDKKKKK